MNISNQINVIIWKTGIFFTENQGKDFGKETDLAQQKRDEAGIQRPIEKAPKEMERLENTSTLVLIRLPLLYVVWNCPKLWSLSIMIELYVRGTYKVSQRPLHFHFLCRYEIFSMWWRNKFEIGWICFLFYKYFLWQQDVYI